MHTCVTWWWGIALGHEMIVLLCNYDEMITHAHTIT